MNVRAPVRDVAALNVHEASKWPSGSETKVGIGIFWGHISTGQTLGWALASILRGEIPEEGWRPGPRYATDLLRSFRFQVTGNATHGGFERELCGLCGTWKARGHLRF